jgi:hypothetical protein
MKASNDTKTADLLPQYDLAGEVLGTVSKGAERAKRFRERHGVKGFTVNMPPEVIDGFNAWFAKNHKGRTKGEVLAGLIKKQLLRPR